MILLWSAGSLFVTALCIMVMRRSRIAALLVDDPVKPQSAHVGVVPRIGGIAIACGVTSTLGLMYASAAFRLATTLQTLLFLVGALCVVSALDDWRSLPPRVRLAAHFAAAAVVLLAMVQHALALPLSASLTFHLLTNSIGVAFVLLAIVWTTNAVNFMDGANGIVGLSLLALLVSLGAIAAWSPQSAGSSVAAICAVFAGAVLGFLWFNVPAGKVFLGDAGSIPLGFFVASLSLYGNLTGLWPLSVPVWLLAPLVADASFTLARRVAGGYSPSTPHATHYYQRLIRSGWPHSRTAAVYAGLSLSGGLVGVALQHQGTSAIWSMTMAVATYTAIALILERKLRRSAPTP